MQKELKRILGSDFKIRESDGLLKVNVPSLDITQMGELWGLYDSGLVRNVTAKRSGAGITLIVEL
jgi:hypothetical protein